MTMQGTFALIYKQILELDVEEMVTLHDDLFKLSKSSYCEYLKQIDS
jgi:hypothetical protein